MTDDVIYILRRERCHRHARMHEVAIISFFLAHIDGTQHTQREKKQGEKILNDPTAM